MKTQLESIIKLFDYYRTLGSEVIDRLEHDQLHDQSNPESNSVAILVKHLTGNMRSRFTAFLEEDGEKEWRNRDREFEGEYSDKNELLSDWNSGWDCVLETLHSLTDDDLKKTVYIRNEGHTAAEAITRQLAHYAYHVGQMVHIGKTLMGKAWKSLSIPKGQSAQYNKVKFSESKGRRHFTDNL